MNHTIPISKNSFSNPTSISFQHPASISDTFRTLFPDHTEFPEPSKNDSLLNVIIRSSNTTVNPALVATLIRGELIFRFGCKLTIIYSALILDDAEVIEVKTTSFPP